MNDRASAPTLGVVIPTLNEASGIGPMLARTQRCLPRAPVLVVDGGSDDGTRAIAEAAGARVIVAPRGRGSQCHAGAEALETHWLLFLHADTLLPENAAAVIACFAGSDGANIATFRMRFDDDSAFLRFCGWCTRFDSVFTRFGDQGILVRRAFYLELGGFPAWPLFEDVALLQRARACTRVHSLCGCVTTSARRFRARGNWRQQWLNARLLLAYLTRRATPEELASRYREAAASPAIAQAPSAPAAATRSP